MWMKRHWSFNFQTERICQNKDSTLLQIDLHWVLPVWKSSVLHGSNFPSLHTVPPEVQDSVHTRKPKQVHICKTWHKSPNWKAHVPHMKKQGWGQKPPTCDPCTKYIPCVTLLPLHPDCPNLVTVFHTPTPYFQGSPSFVQAGLGSRLYKNKHPSIQLTSFLLPPCKSFI